MRSVASAYVSILIGTHVLPGTSRDLKTVKCLPYAKVNRFHRFDSPHSHPMTFTCLSGRSEPSDVGTDASACFSDESSDSSHNSLNESASTNGCLDDLSDLRERSRDLKLPNDSNSQTPLTDLF